jgi:hypothetical protein
MFKIGDKVKIVKEILETPELGDSLIGMEGVINRIYNGYVTLDFDFDDETIFLPEELEIINS